eukprot:TRINITY_DN2416_c0_g1_i1.p1 TRINITY_DN2416_c0_g1~~TRINITY_DN2416_c0_g1_i1.p1  ORF type:complete len:743 (-),score=250.93 TRINITY_DN2416_c0_g1_i1:59-2227(-)
MCIRDRPPPSAHHDQQEIQQEEETRNPGLKLEELPVPSQQSEQVAATPGLNFAELPPPPGHKNVLQAQVVAVEFPVLDTINRTAIAAEFARPTQTFQPPPPQPQIVNPGLNLGGLPPPAQHLQESLQETNESSNPGLNLNELPQPTSQHQQESREGEVTTNPGLNLGELPAPSQQSGQATDTPVLNLGELPPPPGHKNVLSVQVVEPEFPVLDTINRTAVAAEFARPTQTFQPPPPQPQIVNPGLNLADLPTPPQYQQEVSLQDKQDSNPGLNLNELPPPPPQHQQQESPQEEETRNPGLKLEELPAPSQQSEQVAATPVLNLGELPPPPGHKTVLSAQIVALEFPVLDTINRTAIAAEFARPTQTFQPPPPQPQIVNPGLNLAELPTPAQNVEETANPGLNLGELPAPAQHHQEATNQTEQTSNPTLNLGELPAPASQHQEQEPKIEEANHPTLNLEALPPPAQQQEQTKQFENGSNPGLNLSELPPPPGQQQEQSAQATLNLEELPPPAQQRQEETNATLDLGALPPPARQQQAEEQAQPTLNLGALPPPANQQKSEQVTNPGLNLGELPPPPGQQKEQPANATLNLGGLPPPKAEHVNGGEEKEILEKLIFEQGNRFTFGPDNKLAQNETTQDPDILEVSKAELKDSLQLSTQAPVKKVSVTMNEEDERSRLLSDAFHQHKGVFTTIDLKSKEAETRAARPSNKNAPGEKDSCKMCNIM